MRKCHKNISAINISEKACFSLAREELARANSAG